MGKYEKSAEKSANFLKEYEDLKKTKFSIELTGFELMHLYEAMRGVEINMHVGYEGDLYNLVWYAKNIAKKAIMKKGGVNERGRGKERIAKFTASAEED